MAKMFSVMLRSKDSAIGVTQDTLQAIADELGLTQSAVVHLALARFAKEVLPTYEQDIGPLTSKDLAHLRRAANPKLQEGKPVRRRTLL